MDGLKTSLASKEWSSIGANLADGIRNGISNVWGNVTSTVTQLSNNLTNTAQRAFKEHSPSKLWAQIGEYLDLGLAEGIKDEENTVLKTVRNLAAAASGEMKSGNLGISAAGTNAAVQGFSNRISDGVYALVKTLQAIADNVTFRVPNIAAGTVVPAGVSAAVENTSGYGAAPAAYDGGTDYSGILNQILQAVQSGKVFAVDGMVFARLIYEFNQSESNRRGESLVRVTGRGY